MNEDVASPPTDAWIRPVAGMDETRQVENAKDPLVAAAQLRIEQQFAACLPMPDLSLDLLVSQPTLLRGFNTAHYMAPSEFLMM